MIYRKILIITSSDFPPIVGGTGVLTRRIFKYFNNNSFCVLMGNPNKIGKHVDDNLRLKCKYYYCPSPREMGKGSNTRFNRLSEYLYIPMVIIKGYQICHKERVDKILAIPWRSFEIAAYLLHKLLKKQLFVYLFDAYYAHGRLGRFRDNIIKRFERVLIKSSSATFVMSESLRDLYMERYGQKTIHIPHPVELSEYKMKYKDREFPHKQIDIVFTGLISGAQIPLIINLCTAIKNIHDFFIKLKIYTLGNVENLKMQFQGCESFMEISYARPEDMPKIQQEADILYVPMPFTGLPSDIVRTASPSKISEYLAAGKPILVHAPKYSYVSNYARREGWGLVVNELDSPELIKAILKLITDEELRVKLVKNSLRTAKMHDAIRISEKLQNVLSMY